jgi:hypothetical protein
MRVFWDTAFIALMTDAVRTSETSVYSSQTIRRYSQKILIFKLDAVRTSSLTA